MRNNTHIAPTCVAWLVTAAFAVNAAFGARELGLDVSHYQGESGIAAASWQQVYAAGKRFAFIKSTEGLTGPDDNAMSANVARATTAGLTVGVYHYAHAENRPTVAGAIQEANHLLSYAGNAIGPGRLKPVIDLEGRSLQLSTSDLSAWIVAFADTIVAARGEAARPMIYTSSYNANYELDARLANYDLWLVNLNGGDPSTDEPYGDSYPVGATGVFKNWAFWQYSFSGSAGGIAPVDLDVANTSYKPLVAYVIPEPAGLGLVFGIGALTHRRRRSHPRGLGPRIASR